MRTDFKSLQNIPYLLSSAQITQTPCNQTVFKVFLVHPYGVDYIGKIVRFIQDHLAQHQKCLQAGMLSDSATVKYQFKILDRLLFNSLSVVAKYVVCSAKST